MTVGYGSLFIDGGWTALATSATTGVDVDRAVDAARRAGSGSRTTSHRQGQRVRLGGSIWTSDPERGVVLARRIQTGTIGVNRCLPDPGAPFGGTKASGLGRELPADTVHLPLNHGFTREDRPMTGTQKALIIISSGRTVPLAQPAGHADISTGFFLVELARILQDLDDEYEWTFATPDGNKPQLDINGLALWFHAGTGMFDAARATADFASSRDANALRVRLSQEYARRNGELATARALLGRIPVSASLPNSEWETTLVRDEVVESFSSLPEHDYLSVAELVAMDRDPDDPFDLGEFRFAHVPGGNAPMTDMVDNPYLGEVLHRLHEEGAVLSLICHGPVAMASARYRIGTDGGVVPAGDEVLRRARLTTMSKATEIGALDHGYVHVPGEVTRFESFAEDVLRQAGYQVRVAEPGQALVVFDEEANVLSGNGPGAIDELVSTLRGELANRPA